MKLVLRLIALLVLIVSILIGGVIVVQRALPGTAGCLVVTTQSDIPSSQNYKTRVWWLDLETGAIAPRLSFAGAFEYKSLARSPDGRSELRYVYQVDPYNPQRGFINDNANLLLVNTSGDHVIREINTKYYEAQWSPNARYLAYTWAHPTIENRFLLTIAAGGTGQIVQDIPLPTDAQVTLSGWSFDNEAVAVEFFYNKQQSVFLALASGKTFEYRSHSVLITAASWSPIGHRLAFLDSTEGNNSLIVIDPDSQPNIRQFTFNHPVYAMTVAWSPDGHYLLTNSSDHITPELATQRIELISMQPGTDHPAREIVVSVKGARGMDARWRDDGSGFLYLTNSLQTTTTAFKDSLYTYDLASKQTRLLTVGKFKDDILAQKPNFLVMQEGVNGAPSRLILMNQEGKTLQTVGEFGGQSASYFADPSGQ